MMSSLQSISPDSLHPLLESSDITIFDTRPSAEFIRGFIPGAIGIGADGRYEQWAVENAVNSDKIVLVTSSGEENRVADRFLALGTREMLVLDGGFNAWQQSGLPLDMIIEVEADELAMDLPHDPQLVVVDLRNPAEFTESHVANAQNLPLAELTDLAAIANFEENQNLYLHCGGGQRSILAASLLKRQGIHNLRVVQGGFEAIRQQNKIPLEKEVSKLN